MPRAVRFKVPAGQHVVRRPGARADRVRQRPHRGLRHPAVRRPADLSPVGRRATTSTWRSRTSSAATITSRTRRSTCCCSRRSARRSRAFAHVPLILGTDKKRLSKRHGATSVMEYQRLGYLPEAMVNFLALLGWSPGTDEELFTRGELIERFALEGISGGNAVFNPEKLDWFNQQHMMRLPASELAGAGRAAPARGRPLARQLRRGRQGLAGAGHRAVEAAREAAGPVRRRRPAVLRRGRGATIRRRWRSSCSRPGRAGIWRHCGRRSTHRAVRRRAARNRGPGCWPGSGPSSRPP